MEGRVKRLTVQLDEKTRAALDRLAASTGRSRNWLFNEALADYLALDAWQETKIKCGIAAADRGDFASRRDVARVREKFARAFRGSP
jgi:predicted transcriptional regulator